MSDTNNGWPNKDRPGVPLNPERDGWHWLSAMYYDDPIGPPVACFWEAKLERWPRLQDKPGNYPVSRGFCYLSPVATPAEIAAKDARIAELEAALRFANEYVGRLALALAEKHYPEQRFELLPDLLGRIDQIDNMTCGLHRAALAGG